MLLISSMTELNTLIHSFCQVFWLSDIYVVVPYHREPPHNDGVVHGAQSGDDELEVVREVGVRDHDPLGFARRTLVTRKKTVTNTRNSSESMGLVFHNN